LKGHVGVRNRKFNWKGKACIQVKIKPFPAVNFWCLGAKDIIFERNLTRQTEEDFFFPYISDEPWAFDW
jgi:hypothetical protein